MNAYLKPRNVYQYCRTYKIGFLGFYKDLSQQDNPLYLSHTKLRISLWPQRAVVAMLADDPVAMAEYTPVGVGQDDIMQFKGLSNDS